MKKFLLFLVLAIPLILKGQSGLVRVELEAALNSNIYQVVPCGDQGVLVFFETKDEVGENSKNWHFMFYNSDLEEAWNADIAVLAGAGFMDYVIRDSSLVLFFQNEGKVKAIGANFQFVHFDLAKGVTFNVTGNVPAECNFQELIINNSKAFVAFNTKNDQASVYSIDILTGNAAPFGFVYPDQNFIEDIRYDTLQHRLLCLVSNYLERKQNKLYILALDTLGAFMNDMVIMPALESKYLNTGKIYPLPDSSVMVLGAYGNLQARIPGVNEYFGVESSGVFATRIIHGKQEFMNYYNFMEFNNLKAGVTARDYYRLQKKKTREVNEYAVKYELLFHDPVEHDSTLLLFMEAFYPEFRTVSDISYDYWGRPVTQTYTVFDGYRIFNTILAGFDREGEMRWDNSLEVNMAPSSVLLKRSSCFFDGEPSVIFYNDGFRIYYRVYIQNTEMAGFSRVDLETTHTGDRISAAGYNTMAHWYGKYFLAFGYHTIQNNLLSDKNQRTVFYINKIALD
jgi:hypothetical protein